MTVVELLKSLIDSFSPQKLTAFMRAASGSFKPVEQELSQYLEKNAPYSDLRQIGQINFNEAQRLMVAVCRVDRELTTRSGKRGQFDLAKKVLNGTTRFDAGLFAFYDDSGHFRLSLLVRKAMGTRSSFTPFRRYTYFVSPDLPNKTFINQLRHGKFDSLEGWLKTFSIEAVSNDFYQEFEPNFSDLSNSVAGTKESNLKEDFALLFVIRIIFLGFVQKRGWLGNNPLFLQDFCKEYSNQTANNNQFYQDWLKPLFFEALNSPPGRKVSYGIAPFSEETQQILQMAPYLNGELFKQRTGIDDQGFSIPDAQIDNFLNFLFQYNFTIEENTLYDEELELNPEFLGIIFERLVNQADGAVYTPRQEVDLMCRMGLVKWLEKHSEASTEDLYHLFFRNAGSGQEHDADQRQGDFSEAEIEQLIKLLENVTACDPAAGSGAFEVGMLQVLEEVLESLYSRNNTPTALKTNPPSKFQRKKAIIATSLYGVEVKRWAVWINHLRLWLTLFVDMPDDFKTSMEPLLPNLAFKVRTGDSLVQRIGGKTFPVHGHAILPVSVKAKITSLKKRKREFFYNRSDDYRIIENQETQLFGEILNTEINERRAKIRKLLQPKPIQDKMFSGDQPSQAEMNLAAADKQKRVVLESEISELESQVRSLKDTRPFLWSLEFAEIFFDQGGFDIIIGNPPYVNQVKIQDPNMLMNKADYKTALKEMVLLDFPEHFAKSKAQTNIFKTGRKLSGRSDLYTYFYIRSLRLLNSQGVHVFICSNSWLDVGYGGWFQEFLLHSVPIHFIIDNHARRSFANADVNTIITIMNASQKHVPEDHMVRFVAFKRPFEESAIAENLLQAQVADNIFKNEVYQVYPVTVGRLLEEGSEKEGEMLGKYIGNKWGGFYLRAPEIFRYLLGQKHLFMKFSSVANVSGYVHDNNTGESYPKTVFIKSIREANKISLTENDVYLYGVKENGKSRITSDILFARTYGQDHLVLWNLARAIGKEFYKIFAKMIDARSLVLYLNSTFAIMQRELLGITSLGGGAIKFSKHDLEYYVYPKKLSDGIHFSRADEFLTREISSLFNEIGMDPKSNIPISKQKPKPIPDRKALDDIIFDSLDLSQDQRTEIYCDVCQLVWNRVSRAQSG